MDSHLPARTPFLKIFGWLFALLACVAILSGIFLPSILSSTWGKNLALKLINKQIPGRIEIAHLSLGWFGPQDISGVILKDPQGNEILSIQQVIAETSLFTLVWNPTTAGNLQLQSLNAKLTTYPDGTTNFEKTLSKRRSPLNSKREMPPLPMVELKNVQLRLNSATETLPFVLHISGSTQQGVNNGTFTIDAELKNSMAQQLLHQTIGWEDFVNASNNALKIKVDITNLPVELLDQLVAYKTPGLSGLLLEALGSQLNLKITQGSADKSNGIALQLAAQSPKLTAAADAVIKISSGSNNVQASLKGNAVHNGQPMRLDVTAELPKPADWQNWMQTFLLKSAIEARLSGLPLSSIDDLIGLGGTLQAALGPSGDLSLSLVSTGNIPLLNVNWKSANLDVANMSFEINEQIVLQAPGQLTWRINPIWINKALPEHSPRLQNPVTALLTLHSLSLPRATSDSNAQSILQRLAFRADLSVTPMTITGVPKVGNINIQDLVINLLSNGIGNLKMTSTNSLSQPKGDTFLRDTLGENAQVSINGNAQITDGVFEGIEAFDLALNSDLARLQLKGKIQNGNGIVTTSPAIITYRLTTAGLKAFGFDTNNLVFEHKSPLEIMVAPSYIPFNLEDISSLQVNGSFKLGDVTLGRMANGRLSEASIDNMTSEWLFDGIHKEINLSFLADTRLEKQAAGKVKGDISIDNWLHSKILDFGKAKIHAITSISKFPVQILNLLLGKNNLLPLLGNALDVHATADFAPAEKSGIFNIRLESPHLNGNAVLTLNASGYHLFESQSPAELNFILSTDGYEVLRQWLSANAQSNFVLTDNSNAKLKIKRLDLPFAKGSVLPEVFKGGFEIDLLIDHLNGQNIKSKQKIFLSNIHTHLTSPDLSKLIGFNMDAKGQNDQGISTAWNIKGVLEDGFISDGTLNKNHLSLTLDAIAESLPLSLLCQFVCVDPITLRKIDAVIGTTMNANIKLKLKDMNGPIYADIKGKNGHLMLDGRFANKMLLLNQDLIAQVNSSPELSEYILEEIIPIMNGMLSADKPLKLTISQQGFSLPMQDPGLTNVTIGKATLELGKVNFAAHSELAKVLSLLVSAKKQLVVWLTPLYFSINQGTVKIERVDMLINDRYPLAAWGKVDIANDNVNMIIGLTGASISQAFNVPGIPKSYILQLPLRGTLSKADIDKTKAAARLSALVAQAQGSTEGFVLGTVLHIAGGALSESTAPQPTTQPLPWNAMLEDKGQDQDAKAPATKVKGEDENASSKNRTMDEIKKGAGNLIKQFLQK